MHMCNFTITFLAKFFIYANIWIKYVLINYNYNFFLEPNHLRINDFVTKRPRPFILNCSIYYLAFFLNLNQFNGQPSANLGKLLIKEYTIIETLSWTTWSHEKLLVSIQKIYELNQIALELRHEVLCLPLYHCQ